MALPAHFWLANEYNVRGGVENAFMSTTLEPGVAMGYAAGDGGFSVQMSAWAIISSPPPAAAGMMTIQGVGLESSRTSFPLVSTSLMEDMLGASVLKMKRRRAPAGGKSLEVGRGRGPLSD